jgi:hypothetical protein
MHLIHVCIRMSVSGLCGICEAAEARYSCHRCGGLVCVAHYDRDAGLCTECAKETGVGSPDREPNRSPDEFLR